MNIPSWIVLARETENCDCDCKPAFKDSLTSS